MNDISGDGAAFNAAIVTDLDGDIDLDAARRVAAEQNLLSAISKVEKLRDQLAGAEQRLTETQQELDSL